MPLRIRKATGASRSFDIKSKDWRLTRVEEVFVREYSGEQIRVHVANDVIEATPGHPFWVAYGDDLDSRPVGEHQKLGQIPSEGTTPGRWVDSHDLLVGDVVLLQDGSLEPITAIEISQHVGPVFHFRVAELQCYAVGTCCALVHNSCGHDADWILSNSNGKRIASGSESSGVDFALKKGQRLSFPEQSWYGHTKGKIVDDLMDADLLRPGRVLQIEGTLPPCSGCRNIMQWTSHTYNMTVDYVDGVGNTWTWVRGFLQGK